MRNKRKAIALLLAFVFILTTFAGCKKEESDPADAFRYVATAHTLDCGELEYVENVAMSDSKVYFFGQNVIGTETQTDPETGDSWDNDVYGYAFYSANLDGTDLKKLDYTVDMDGNILPTVESPVESYNWVAQMFVANDGRLFVILRASLRLRSLHGKSLGISQLLFRKLLPRHRRRRRQAPEYHAPQRQQL